MMLERLHKMNTMLANILLGIGGVGLVLMTLIVGWQVFGRYVLNDSPSWAEQSALLLMLWYSFLAAAAGFHQSFHIKIVAAQIAFGKIWERRLRMLAEAIIMVCGILFIIWGIKIATTTATHVIPSIGLSRGWAYAPLPIAGVFIVLFSATRLAGELLQPGWTREHPDEAPEMLDGVVLKGDA